MDKLTRYREYIQQLLSDYASSSPKGQDFETEVIFDVVRDRYLVVHTGWEKRQAMYGCVLHVDLKNDGKIWIHYDGTEVGIANELVRLGVPRSDIVLAFHEPLLRPYTDFAVS
ncbi:XisI protein [Tumidithrix elongata RA019]|uniref:XisI protein n=1 Tax=Tumidithrix elongata BACA0141 TaxID=2716417 RepID=A0AAW9PRI4_9CYAN|nr:XisI protein [Tumidithrix elongata RA019]